MFLQAIDAPQLQISSNWGSKPKVPANDAYSAQNSTLLNLCLHHECILDRWCQFLSLIFLSCGKFWFSAFIWRKLRLKHIECSQVLTVSLLLVTERVVCGFNASRAVILMSRTGNGGEKEKFFQWFRIGGITCVRLVPNARRIGRIIGNDTTRHFETPQSHGKCSEARKLSSVWDEAERCWTAFLCLWTAASKRESEGVFTLHCNRRRNVDPLR